MKSNWIDYSEPKVYLIQQSGIGSSELAGRTAYNSFELSENEIIKEVNQKANNEEEILFDDLNNIEYSNLLDNLAWVHHHHSVIEHCNLTFLIKGTSRGVLQEHARHRIQSLTVQSTRYTMDKLINVFCVSFFAMDPEKWFIEKSLQLDMFVTTQRDYNILQLQDIFRKLTFQMKEADKNDETFFQAALSKSNYEIFENYLKLGIVDIDEVFEVISNGKKKRNVGDAFKHIVNDNWKVDMVVTFNLRSLKNYFDLRNSGAAYFQIQILAKKMIEIIPEKYKKLILKEFKN